MRSKDVVQESNDKAGRSKGCLKRQRRKIWDLDSHLHCSIIGTCLSLDELRRLARKIGIARGTAADDYRLHTAFVGLVDKRSGEARLVNRHLDKKYKEVVRRISGVREATALRALWREALASGEVAAAYWALVTHPQAPEDLLYDVYGQVHMLSHLSGASLRVDLQKLNHLRRRVPQLERQIQTQQAQSQRVLEEKRRIILQLRNEVEALRKSNLDAEQLRAQLRRLENSEVVQDLRARLEKYTDLLAKSRTEAERAAAEAAKWKAEAERRSWEYRHLEARIEWTKEERDALEQSLERLLTPDCGSCEDSDHCTAEFDLCNRCILFVGGRNRQCAHFKALVERRNGQFVHHDGGLEESSRRLAALLARADAVLCPLDCVSHEAMNRIKRDCERYGKSLQLLPRASLAAFNRGLQEVAGE
ncbi:MAG TPA: DUF2325 domain-containing protein [Chromatiales bacterium]|nr:DUF2325 domain-containing protein [Chromatiales bacterium]